MAYTSKAEVLKVMTNLPVRIQNDDTFFDTKIEKADAFINAELAEVYPVPFTEAPDLIKHIATDLTVFFVAEDLYTSDKPNLDSYHEKRYNRAMDMLNKIAIGDLFIDTPRRSGSTSGFQSTNQEVIFTYEEPEW